MADAEHPVDSGLGLKYYSKKKAAIRIYKISLIWKPSLSGLALAVTTANNFLSLHIFFHNHRNSNLPAEPRTPTKQFKVLASRGAL